MGRESDAQAAIDAHLAAIVGRDLPAFAASLHPDVTVVVPSGRMMTGAAEVVAFHETWFANPEWTYAVVSTRSATAATAAVRVAEVTYVDGPGAEPSRFAMGLTFVREDNSWLLIHDQCTVLRTE